MDLSPPEITYQMLNAVDMAQTIEIAQHPDKWSEAQSKWAIGEHPTKVHVVGYMVGEAIIHEIVSTELKEHGYTVLYKIWETVTITDKAQAVRGNWQVGLRIRF